MGGNSTMNKSNQRVQEITGRKPNNNLLWIYGNPGCGKTWLTTLLIEDLLSRKDLIFLQQEPTVAHYFCSYTKSTRTADILRSILAQLLHVHRDNHEVVDAYCFCYSKSIAPIATSNSQLMQLLEITLRRLHNVFIVIDGLDECQDRDQIAPFLLRLSLQPSLVKVLILARDSDTILRRKLTLFKGLEITNYLNHADILAYALSRIEDLVDYLSWDSFHRLISWADAANTHILKAKDEDLVGFTKRFVRDFQDLQSNFDQELNSHPHHVWTGMTDCSSVGGPLKSSRSTIIVCEQEAPEQLDGTGSSTPWDTDSPVAVISELSTDCKSLLVCSVWASRDFSSLLQIESKTTAGRLSLPSCLDFKKVASGWILRLETWDLISRKKVAFPKDLPLNPLEVENQLRKSFCYDALRKPRFGFPMALSPNHDFIAVLGSIYRIEINQIPSKTVEWWVKSLETQETGSACYHDYRIKFSPCSEFVAYHIARRYREPPHLDGGETLEVFGLAQDSTSKPIWRRDVPCFSNSPLIREDIPNYESASSSLIVAFHPTLTLVAWSGPMMGTYISDFIHEKIGLGINLTHQEIGELRFSNCGRLLFGKEDYKHLGRPVYFLVTEAGIPPIENPDAIEVTRLGDSVFTKRDLSMVPQQLLNEPMQTTPTQELRVGSFLSSSPNGSTSISVIARVKSANGQINIQQISNQRGMEERQIASLPASILNSSSETRVVQHINPGDGSSDELKIVLNKIGNS
ncbi:hypothetical protein N7520_005357 [Penicillium odoratum]|uniref:uncharacterized protein n=1 Tax=Penicillium odoratum TaxID=1167516 RepID=UPI0025497415|nr:uncharacterized protein N7520_005357 [Penicillium odoratum]KAJ5765798.1 hypothetical protein N7520_005357 [Penicillium odoratum]